MYLEQAWLHAKTHMTHYITSAEKERERNDKRHLKHSLADQPPYVDSWRRKFFGFCSWADKIPSLNIAIYFIRMSEHMVNWIDKRQKAWAKQTCDAQMRSGNA